MRHDRNDCRQIAHPVRLERLTTQGKEEPLKGPHQYDAVTRIHVAILGERRTRVRGHRFQFDVGRQRSPMFGSKEPFPGWDHIGETLVLADQIVVRGSDAMFIRARNEVGKSYEAELTEIFTLLRTSAKAQLEVAEASLKIVEVCSKQADALTSFAGNHGLEQNVQP